MTFTKDQLAQITMALAEHLADTAKHLDAARKFGADEAVAYWEKTYADTANALNVILNGEA